MNIHPHVLVRRPIYSKAALDQLFEVEDKEAYVLDLIHNEAFMERILIASEDLYDDLLRIRQEGIPLPKDKIRKVMKYVIRMSSRAMPFGLFAGIARRGVSLNEMEDESHKKIRVSVEWLQHTARRMEQMLPAHSAILINKNARLLETPDTFYVDLARDNDIYRAELRKTPFITRLMMHLDTPKSVEELIRSVMEDATGLEEKIVQSIKLLLRQDLLISELRPGTFVSSELHGLEQLINAAMELDKDMYIQLQAIECLLAQYEAMPVGEGILLYLKLKEQMKAVCVSNRYVAIDSYVEDVSPQLNMDNVYSFVQDIDFLKSFQSLHTYKIWGDYCHQFVDRYGMFHDVPLLHVLDGDLGIGLPNVKVDLSEQERKLDHYLLGVIQEAIIRGQSEVVLTDKHLRRIEEIVRGTRHNKIQGGYDVKFNLITEHGIEKILLTENSFRQTAGSFSGRFADSAHYPMPKYRDEVYISAEINAVPLNYADIGITYYQSDYEIVTHAHPSGSVHQIQINDLYVGVDYDGMYVKSRALGKKIVPVTTHLLNYRNFIENPEIIFLSEFGKYRCDAPKNISCESMRKLTFVPRFEYKQIILSPRRWNLFKADMLIEMALEGVNEEQYLEKFFELFNVTNAVQLLKGDQTLTVYSHTALGRSLMIDELKRLGPNGCLTLIEAVEVSTSTNQDYIHDYVISVLPEERQMGSLGPGLVIHHQPVACDLSWTYMKVYYKKGKRMTTQQLCLDYMREQGIQKCFVVSYIDSEEHLRIRYQAEDEQEKAGFRCYMEELLLQSTINRFTEDIFFPEQERYGGSEFVDRAYDLFCLETTLLGELCQSIEFKRRPSREIGLILCIHAVIDMFASFEDGLQFLDRMAEQVGRSHVKSFKKQRGAYIALGMEALELYTQYPEICDQLQLDRRSYASRITAHFPEDHAFYILNSMLHMTMNRFIGIDLQLERELMEVASYTYYNMKYKLMKAGGRYELV